ncbi:MAG: SDR family oxidoreductase [Acidobacteria bacterium]|nr:SDR family oxidoreductase [Acidobacteriota bacterium]
MSARRTALVTGASSGIGAAFAEACASHGFDVVLCARREDRLRALAGRLEGAYGVRAHVVTLDLAEPGASARLWSILAGQSLAVDMLVNSAGYGLPGAYLASGWDAHERFLRVSLLAPAELTHLVLPAMVERGYGRIIHVASLAALAPAPGGHTMYAAAKVFFVRFSEALAHEVGHRNVHVTAVCPGFTRSEFHDVTGTRAMVGRLPPWLWMDAAAVAAEGFEAVMAGRPVVVTGLVNRALAALVRFLPRPLVTRVNQRLSRSYRRV